MIILVINCGSSMVKYELFEAADGRVESLGQGQEAPSDGYDKAVGRIVASLGRRPDAVVHRVVHGGVLFVRPTLIDAGVIEAIRALSPLAPLHNPPALAGIEACAGLGVPMVACFDTSFHRTLPEVAWRYAIPKLLTATGLIRYGFHGLSHQYVNERYAELTGNPRPTIVTLHLGGGCSATAVREGRSVDTSMGLTPLEGLVMGTRSGDVDPAITSRLAAMGLDADRVLNQQSGLLGLAGESGMRELLARTDDDATLAIDLFCYRVRKYVGAYLAALGGAEAIVFTGGIGENSAEVRRRVCEGLGWAGLVLDPTRNAAGPGRISTDASTLHAWVIPTDEEKLMAREAARLLGGGRR